MLQIKLQTGCYSLHSCHVICSSSSVWFLRWPHLCDVWDPRSVCCVLKARENVFLSLMEFLWNYCTLDNRGSIVFYINEAFGLQIQTLVSGFLFTKRQHTDCHDIGVHCKCTLTGTKHIIVLVKDIRDTLFPLQFNNLHNTGPALLRIIFFFFFLSLNTCHPLVRLRLLRNKYLKAPVQTFSTNKLDFKEAISQMCWVFTVWRF